MEKENNSGTDTTDREIVITRMLNAPRELVYTAFTDPEQVGQWWGPTGFTTTTHEMDVKPGGVWKFIMHGPDGTDYPNRMIFSEVVKPERLVYQYDSGEDDDPGQMQVTTTFEAHGNKTKLTMRSIFRSAAIRDKVIKEYGAMEGGNQTMDRLQAFLSKVSV